MFKTFFALTLISSLGLAAELTNLKKVSDPGIENFVAYFGALKPDHPVFEDQASGDVFRVKVGKKAADEKWLNTVKQIVHRANAAQQRQKIESLTLYTSSPSKKAVTKAFNLITGRIKDNGTEAKLKSLLEDAVEGKEAKSYVLYSGNYDTSSNSCEVVAVQDVKKSEIALLTSCYNE